MAFTGMAIPEDTQTKLESEANAINRARKEGSIRNAMVIVLDRIEKANAALVEYERELKALRVRADKLDIK